jgi:hypothetical protein
LITRLARWLIDRALRIERLDSYLKDRYTHPFIRSGQFRFAAPGHFYSPLPDVRYVEEHAADIYSDPDGSGTGIDLNDLGQEKLLQAFVAYYEGFDWAGHPIPGRRFSLDNAFFGFGDAIVLFCMLRHFCPKQVIEVGSGHSSALMLDTNDRFLGGGTQFTFVEPYPDRLLALLKESEGQAHKVIDRKVQDVSLDYYDRLEANDVLFIDSSHVSKAGSDVNYLIFKVLPKLRRGVLVHIHDVFWPFEYPLAWVQGGRAWNEAYLIRAFLQYNSTFEILVFNDYIGKRFRGLLSDSMPLFLKNSGGSLWLRRV